MGKSVSKSTLTRVCNALVGAHISMSIFIVLGVYPGESSKLPTGIAHSVGPMPFQTLKIIPGPLPGSGCSPFIPRN